MCSQLKLDSNSCRGYLLKMSGSRMGFKLKTWNKRWFVFDRAKRTIVYFADKSEAKAKGGISFQVLWWSRGELGQLLPDVLGSTTITAYASY